MKEEAKSKEASQKAPDELTKKLSQLLKGFKSYLLSEHPFFATVALNLKYVVKEDVSSLAGTDCYQTVYVHPSLAEYSWDAFLFVNLHELLHAVFMHSQRKEERDLMLWNVACDYVVNSILVEEMRLPLPHDLFVLYNPGFSKKTAEEVYRILSQTASQRKKLVLTFRNGKNENFTSEVPVIPVSGNLSDNRESRFDGVLQPFDLKKSKAPREEIERIKDIVAQAKIMQEKLKGRGTIPGSVAEFVERIFEPDVPFERLLALYASEIISGKQTYTYNPVNKKYAYFYDVIYPSITKEEVPRVVVAVDSSGSMSKEDLELAAGAIKRLSTITPEVTVIVADCEVHQVIRTNEIDEFLKNVRFEGRGGTSHVPVFEHVEKKMKDALPDVVICITDGYSEYPSKKPKYPVIWLLTEKHQSPPWGMKVVMKKRRNLGLTKLKRLTP